MNTLMNLGGPDIGQDKDTLVLINGKLCIMSSSGDIVAEVVTEGTGQPVPLGGLNGSTMSAEKFLSECQKLGI